MNQEFSASHPGKECAEAINLGVQSFIQQAINPEDYVLIAAETLHRGPKYEGPKVWRLTFKLKSLIPQDQNGMLGAGGEVFVRVDLVTHLTTIKYGE